MAVEETVVHPDDPMTGPVLAALGVGVALFVASSALSLRTLGGPLLLVRLATLALMAAGLVIVGVMRTPPVVPLGVVAAALLAIVLVESIQPPATRSAAEG